MADLVAVHVPEVAAGAVAARAVLEEDRVRAVVVALGRQSRTRVRFTRQASGKVLECAYIWVRWGTCLGRLPLADRAAPAVVVELPARGRRVRARARYVDAQRAAAALLPVKKSRGALSRHEDPDRSCAMQRVPI